MSKEYPNIILMLDYIYIYIYIYINKDETIQGFFIYFSKPCLLKTLCLNIFRKFIFDPFVLIV